MTALDESFSIWSVIYANENTSSMRPLIFFMTISPLDRSFNPALFEHQTNLKKMIVSDNFIGCFDLFSHLCITSSKLLKCREDTFSVYLNRRFIFRMFIFRDFSFGIQFCLCSSDAKNCYDDSFEFVSLLFS